MAHTAIIQSATKFTQSYAAACALAITSPGISTDKIATAIASHYKAENFASFTSGHTILFANPEVSQQSVKSHLDSIARQGFGLDIRFERLRVEPLSGGCAMCFVTWSLHPPAERGVEPWEWENVYSYREVEGVGKWEFTVADNEIAGLMARAPRFWERDE